MNQTVKHTARKFVKQTCCTGSHFIKRARKVCKNQREKFHNGCIYETVHKCVLSVFNTRVDTRIPVFGAILTTIYCGVLAVSGK